MKLALIVAMTRTRVIGDQNRLPWKLPADLRYFREVTRGHPVIMGRKTHESIGRLLPERENIVITRQKGLQIPGAWIVGSVSDAIRLARRFAAEKNLGQAFVIGGAQIYAEALPFVERFYITQIEPEFSGDAYFPELPPDLILVHERVELDPFPHRFQLFSRD